MLRIILFMGLQYSVHSAPPEKRQIRTGIVPIFNPDMTVEPVTFTFTTPRTRLDNQYPVNAQSSNNPFPTLRPATFVSFEPVIQSNQNKGHSKIWETPIDYGDAISKVFGAIKNNAAVIKTPIYNQAQYFRALQASVNQATSTPAPIAPMAQLAPLVPLAPQPAEVPSPNYDAIWRQMSSSWQQMKSGLVNVGVERDWRQLWTKITGVVEPFLSQFSEQAGKAANMFLTQAKNRLHRQQPLFRIDSQSLQDAVPEDDQAVTNSHD